MKFKLRTSGNFYSPKDIEPLEALGFKFEDTSLVDKKTKYKIEDAEVEINSLEQLMEFVSKYGEIVLSNDAIEIYDDYRE